MGRIKNAIRNKVKEEIGDEFRDTLEFDHSHYYHSYFSGYTEYKVPRENGRGHKIVRIYTAPYHMQDVSRKQWYLNKLRNFLLSAAACVLLTAGMSVDSGCNRVWYVALPGLLSAAAAVLLIAVSIFYILAPRRMTHYQYYNTHSRTLQFGIVYAVLAGLATAGVLFFLILGADRMSALLAIILDILGTLCAVMLGIAENKTPYRLDKNEIEEPAEGNTI